MIRPKSPVTFPVLRDAIERLRRRGVTETTTEKVIIEIEGEYTVDTDTPVKASRNAGVGRELKAYAEPLRIVEKQPKRKFFASDGRQSCCSVWTIPA